MFVQGKLSQAFDKVIFHNMQKNKTEKLEQVMMTSQKNKDR